MNGIDEKKNKYSLLRLLQKRKVISKYGTDLELFSLLLLLAAYSLFFFIFFHRLKVGGSVREHVILPVAATASGALGKTPVSASGTISTSGLTVGMTVRQVACGEAHTLFLTFQGEVLASGSNLFGQLGDGTTVDHYSVNLTLDFFFACASSVASVNEYKTHFLCLLLLSSSNLCWRRTRCSFLLFAYILTPHG